MTTDNRVPNEPGWWWQNGVPRLVHRNRHGALVVEAPLGAAGLVELYVQDVEFWGERARPDDAAVVRELRRVVNDQLGTAGAGMDVVSDVDAALGRLVSGAQSPNRAALPGEAASTTPIVKALEWDAGIQRTLGADGFPSDVVHESEADRWAELALDLGARCADLRRALAVAEGRLAYVKRLSTRVVGHRDVLDSGLTIGQCEAWLTASGWSLASDPAQRWRCWSKPGHRDRWILPDHDQWPHQQAAGIAVLIEAVAEEAGRQPAEVLAEMLSTEADDG